MALLAGAGTSIILLTLLGISIMVNMQYIAFEKKFPSIKQIRVASRKGMQLAWIHDPEGSCSAVAMKLVVGSNQLDLDKYSEMYGVKFKPRDMNQSEIFDRKLPTFHYMAAFPHNVTVRGVASLSRVRRILEAKGVMATPEKLTTLMHRDLEQPNDEVRKTMVAGSEARIPNDELERLRDVQRELKTTKSNTVGPFVFADANDFLYSVGMSAAGSLREWKSYITAVARGEVPKPGLTLDIKSIGMLLLFAAIAYVITKAGTMGSVVSSIKV